ncbi:MAG: flagellar motor switch protein FliM [Alphaproteobacteria bacterium]|nr:flagellar motor switch protein FliM [Alphaproteobacteria bacterium]
MAEDDGPIPDTLADEWKFALDEQLGDSVSKDEVSQWSSIINSAMRGDSNSHSNVERLLVQDEIDNLFGFDLKENTSSQTGVEVLIGSTMVSYERLPMLEVIFDRLVRLMTTSMRGFTSDNVEVSLDTISSVRFGDYLDSIPLPSILPVFKAREWDNYGLFVLDSKLIYSTVDIFLGGRKKASEPSFETRPYTTIEVNLVKQMIEVILNDMQRAFEPVSPVAFELERLETNPRFAAISRPANAAILAKLRVDVEDRGGQIEILLPYATIEPIRELLLQMFMGEKFGRDPIWESHLATQLWSAEISIEAVLDELAIPLHQLMDLKVGETLFFNVMPEDLVDLRCGDIHLTHGRMGRSGDYIAVNVNKGLARPKMSLFAFESADGVRMEGV